MPNHRYVLLALSDEPFEKDALKKIEEGDGIQHFITKKVSLGFANPGVTDQGKGSGNL